MPIRRKKMDEVEEDDGVDSSTTLFHPSNNTIGLGEHLTKSPSSLSTTTRTAAKKETSTTTTTSAAVDDDDTVNSNNVISDESCVNDEDDNGNGEMSEVSQMLADALQQIDSVIAETGRSRMEAPPPLSALANNNLTTTNGQRNHVDNGAANGQQYSQSQRLNSDQLASMTSSSSSSNSSGESTSSDLGVIMETDELLTPTSPTTTSATITAGESNNANNNDRKKNHHHHQEQRAVFNASLTSSVFVQQLALRLAETLNRLSSSSSGNVLAAAAQHDEHDPDAILNSSSSSQQHHQSTTLPRPDPVVAHVLLRWLRAYDETRSPSPSMSTVSCPEYVELQDKLHRLETDRESLSLQVSVLAEQVGAQSDKIKDLESLLDDKRRKLDSTEEMLHDELSTRSGLETDRLDLLSEISQLKLKLASLERDKISTQHKLRSAQGEIHGLQRVMQDRYNEIVAVQSQHQQQQQQQQQSANRTPQHMPYSNLPPIAPKPATSGMDPAGEIEHLRSAVQHLMSENAEKEQRIEQMRMLMERQLLRNTSTSTNGHSTLGRNSDGDVSNVGLAYAHRSGSIGSATMLGTSALPNSASAHFSQQQQHIHHGRHPQQPVDLDINRQLRHLLTEEDETTPVGGPSTSLPTSASFPDTFLYNARPPPYPSNAYGHALGAAGASMQSSASYNSNLSSTLNTSSASGASAQQGAGGSTVATWSAPVTPHHQQQQQQQQQQTANNANANVPRTAARQLAAELNELMPQYRRSPLGFYHTGSLPRGIGQNSSSPNKKKSDAGLVNSGESPRPTARQPKRGLKWLLHLKATSKRSTSAPNLERLEDDADEEECRNDSNLLDSDEDGGKSSPRQTGGAKKDKKQKTLKTFISKLKRSNSQEFENGDLGNGESFRRGGFVRATAGPRLRSWSREPHMQRSIPIRPTVDQFGKWASEDVADWLNEIGLTMYVADCRRNIRTGRHMMSLTPIEIEKELGVKNQLHRKKLIIAMRNIELGKSEPSDQMDYHQVLRWLDDVGLPQYRDVFAEHRVDGSLLSLLTVDDLLQMRINSALHHATLARGIQILRMVGFNLNRFIRKFNSEVIGKGPLPNQVQLWSQHCVTEWLRTIDLTEFTPNLMCAGIHGALLVLEPTFTAESLAAVLQMPTQKTLLRRHLTTHFNQLLGQDIVAGKRETLSIPFAVQLMPGLKVKAAKKGFSLARRKHNRTEVYMEPDDLVCPLTPNRKPPSSAALLERLPESISEQMLHSLSSSNV